MDSLKQNIVSATFTDDIKPVYHSYNDEPAVYYRSGAMEWYLKGVLHRENDKPALIYKDGTKIWYQNGEVSRYNGPAIIWYDNPKLKTYCIQGRMLNPFNRTIKCPTTEEEKIGYFNKPLFIIKDEVPYIFNEYMIKFEKKIFDKYLILFN